MGNRIPANLITNQNGVNAMDKTAIYELLQKLASISDKLIELQVETHDLHSEFYDHLFEKNEGKIENGKKE